MRVWKKLKRDSRAKELLLILFIFLTTLVIYRVTNFNKVSLDGEHYIYLANAFLEGRVDIPGVPQNYPDVFNINGRIVTILPPMPAVILMPFAFFWGTNFTQLPLVQLLGAVNVALIWVLLSKLKFKIGIKLFLIILFGFGTVHWFAADIGKSWYFAHLTAIFFLLLSLLVLFITKRYFFSGLFLGFAFLARDPVIFGATFFITNIFLQQEPLKITIDRQRFWNLATFTAGILISISAFFSYNYARFGNYLDNGYVRSYNFYTESKIFKHNLLKATFSDNFPQSKPLDLRNVPLHLHIIFMQGPEVIPYFPFIKPSVYGTSILITSPLLLLAFFSLIKKKEVVASWIASLAIITPLFFWYSQGWVQFGYRFVLDFLPFLIIILAYRLSRGISLGHIALLGWSILINFWGIWWWFWR